MSDLSFIFGNFFTLPDESLYQSVAHIQYNRSLYNTDTCVPTINIGTDLIRVMSGLSCRKLDPATIILMKKR